MKNIKKYIFSFSLFCVIFIAFACLGASADVSIDTSAVAKGYVTANYTDGSASKIKVQVIMGSSNYVYDITGMKSIKIPLQMGPGSYKAMILENISGTTYKPLASETFTVPAVADKDLYTISNPIINYSASTVAIPAINQLFAANSAKSKATVLYQYLVKNWVYDTPKSKNLSGDYVPVLDTVYKAKKGICYDYSAVLAGGLRKNGIPTRLVMGYASYIDVYHAWNEIYINGKWVIVDSTADSSYYKGNKNYDLTKNFAKNPKNFKIVKVY